MAERNDRFYEQLPGFQDFPRFTELTHYHPPPADWFLVIADIENSTHAIGRGKYKDVNAVAAATIMAVLNAVSPTRIPYVFGGDGATLCIPGSTRRGVAEALLAAKIMAKQEFKLSLRIGMVPIRLLQEKGLPVLVGKFCPEPCFQQAMLIGEGIHFAEKQVKSAPEAGNDYLIDSKGMKPNGNFEGFECRWLEVKSPREEDVAILVQALPNDNASKSTIYQEVISKIYEIYGNERRHVPIATGGLKLALSPPQLVTEARIGKLITGKGILLNLMKLFVIALAGKWLMKYKIKTRETDWGGYKQRLVNNTDFRRLEDCLKLLIAGTIEQQETLRRILEDLREQGKIVYGIHSSKAATITCLVFNYDQDHIHFLDGADGGFTRAAVEMKAQLDALPRSPGTNGIRDQN